MPPAARGNNMKTHEFAGTAVLAMLGLLPAQLGSVAQDSVVRDDTVRITAARAWREADLPYARPPAPARHSSVAGSARHAAGAAVPAQQASVIRPVPETSLYSMLLVGLGLLALCVPRNRQEKFDQGR